MKHVLLLHGALGCGKDLASLANELRETETLLHTFTFPGHGNTPFPQDFSIPALAGATAQFLTDQGINQCHVFGYSMGAYVALYLSLQHPDKIRSICSYGTKFNWEEEQVKKETTLLNPAKMKEKIPGFVSQLKEKHGEHWEALVERTADLMRDIGKHDYLSSKRLQSILIPVQLGHGSKDHMVTWQETEQTASNLMNGSAYSFENGKHDLSSVNPEILSKRILNLIQTAEHT